MKQQNASVHRAINHDYTALYSSCVPDAVRERILACQTEDDWDDEGATGITFEACEAAIAFLEAVWKCSDTVPVPGISPSVYGAVSLYWRSQEEHLIIRPFAGSVSFQHEKEGSSSVYAVETLGQAVHRVLTFFSAAHAQQN